MAMMPFDSAVFAINSSMELEQRNQRGAALRRKALRAGVALLQTCSNNSAGSAVRELLPWFGLRRAFRVARNPLAAAGSGR